MRQYDPFSKHFITVLMSKLRLPTIIAIISPPLVPLAAVLQVPVEGEGGQQQQQEVAGGEHGQGGPQLQHGHTISRVEQMAFSPS